MARFALRRLAAAVPLLLVTSFIVFAFIHVAPGNPESILLGGRRVDAATLAAIRAVMERHEKRGQSPFFVCRKSRPFACARFGC
jgi:ABC-type dipeptide/oligopeptide/nickel transport system permease component